MTQSRPSNRLLDALPPSCRERLLAVSAHVDLELGEGIFEHGPKPRFLYFLTSGMASVVFSSEAGATVELSAKGREGLLGWVFLLGSASAAYDCQMQVAGAGYRIPLAEMQREFDSAPETRLRVLEYIQHQYGVVSQVAACNRLHRAEARFVRWLLMVSDRIESDELSMTQEFLSMLLGARRTTVAEVCAELARAGAIEGRRGGLRILSRPALEARVCECYGILQPRFHALYQQPLRPLASRPALAAAEGAHR